MDPMDTARADDSLPGSTSTSADHGESRPILKRVRSSYDERDPLDQGEHGGVGPVESSSMVLKGFSQDVLDYPRRRATIACEICRSRKSRCDGARPKCRLCTELNADCNYREPGIKLDAGDKLILEQLSRIEGMLASGLLSPMTSNALPGPISPDASTSASDEFALKRMSIAGNTMPTSLPLNGLGTWSANISTMPKTHTTPALHLLQWPVVRDLISRQCDPQVLMQLEMAREPLDLNRQYPLDLANVESYARAFFDRVNVWYAIVNPYTWNQYYRAAVSVGFSSGAESCLVLLVLALGEAAQSGQSISRVPRGQHAPGMSYFATAWHTLPSLMIKNDVLSAQCHILAAAYLLYLVRPLEAWNLLCNASMKQQLLLASPHAIAHHLKELSERVFWNTLMIESDLLAELDLPHSGIVQYEESMMLPRSFPYDAAIVGNEELLGNDEIWYFLAEIALRRLLNRVSHLIYTHKRSTSFSLSSLEPLVAELDLQLTQWYDGLPEPVKFPRERLPARNQIQTVLRLRYFACRTIIYRPYIQAVLTDENLAYEPGVQDACQKCLEACIRQLEYIPAHHEGHLPYLFQGALSIMSQTLLLMGATLSNTLPALLPPAHQCNLIIAEVVAELNRLAHLAPSLQLCAEIVGEAEQRRQVLMKHLKR